MFFPLNIGPWPLVWSLSVFSCLLCLLPGEADCLQFILYSSLPCKHRLSLLHFPYGFLSKASQVMLVCSRCPSPLSILDGVSDGLLPSFSPQVLIKMPSGHLMQRIWWRKLLTKICNLWYNFMVHLLVSAPYRRTDYTLLESHWSL